ncbi:hypothetical protein BDZ89DRAFT_1131598 [Hymenopellis radicata]|nr:hypothetical protein BDZ89DRAFT_1131598 [Hymenopellis radicata]
MNNPLLPPELVELIVEHSAGDEWVRNSALMHSGSGYDWLQSCALISRSWVVPCQRALFHDISLYDYNRVVRLLRHLQRYSHLQNLIQWMIIWQTPADLRGPLRRPSLQPFQAISWFSSMLLHLANSRTTVHFVELTFTFVEIDDVEAVSAEWATLDEVLSHAAFTGVQRIHFEEDSDEKALITDQAEPELASAIQRALPRLASRGVLCFE